MAAADCGVDKDRTINAPALKLAVSRVDLLNVGLLLLALLCVLLFVSPAHSFPIIDDWIYRHASESLLAFDYQQHGAQASALGSVAVGALFMAVLGQSFTSLAVSTLVLSVIGLLALYALFRDLHIAPCYALLGTALVLFNPMYIFLSYTFMTDVPFFCFVTSGALCLTRGVRSLGTKTGALWLYAGSIAVAFSYLTRQFGLLLLVAVLVYLWWSRCLDRRTVFAVTAIPLVSIVAYMLWEKTQSTSGLSDYAYLVFGAALRDPLRYAWVRGVAVGSLLLPVGLSMLPIPLLPKHPLRAAPVVTLLVGLGLVNVATTGSFFPAQGNVLDNTGLVLWNYVAKPIWAEWVWSLLAVVGALVLSLYLVACGESALNWWRKPSKREHSDPSLIVLYLFALMMLVTLIFVTPSVVDRYILPILPMLFLPALLRASSRAQLATRRNNLILFGRWAMLSILGLYAIIGLRDYMEHSTVRWEAAERLAATGVSRDKIDAGFEWQGWYLNAAGEQRLRELGQWPPTYFPPFAVLDRLYVFSDLPQAGYDIVGSTPYVSWLNGGETRYVLLLKRQ